MADGVKSLNG